MIYLLIACGESQATTPGQNNDTPSDSTYEHCPDVQVTCPEPVINLTCPEPVIENIIQTDCPDIEISCPESNINISNEIDTQPIADELVSLTEAITMQAGEWAAIKIQPPISGYAPNGNPNYSSTTWTNTDSRPFLVEAIYGGSLEYDINTDGYGDLELREAYTSGTVYYGWNWTNLNSLIESQETVYVTCGDSNNRTGQCLIVGKYLNQ
jgi:hypothetical protein